MEYSVGIPYWVLKKGDYTVRAEMDATNGSRMTAFEGTVFVVGEAGDSHGGWGRVLEEAYLAAARKGAPVAQQFWEVRIPVRMDW
jgi:hypothetical protein